MKTRFIIQLVLLSLLAFPSWGSSKDKLVERNGLLYMKFTDKPFTGDVKGQWQGSVKNGKKEGFWSFYHDNGQLSMKGNYKNGNRDGAWIFYHENGGLLFKGSYKNWKKEGLWIAYYETGQLWYQGSYKNDEREGVWIGYSEYGEKDPIYTGTYKNGVRIGD